MRKRARATFLSIVAAWSLAVSPLLSGAAWAQTGNRELDEAIALYEDLELALAVDGLKRALGQKNLSKQELIEGYKYLGLSYVALGEDASAQEAFLQLLQISPKFSLPATENPRALDVFAAVKESFLAEMAVELTHSFAPARPRPGAPVEVTIAIRDAGNAHARVVVHHRVAGQKAFSSVVGAPAGERQYKATIPGAFVGPPGVDYFVVAEGADGKVLATAGTEAAPAAIAVDKPAKAVAAAPAVAWWMWASLGGLVLAGAAVGLALASGDTPPPDSDATVTISVDYQ